LNVLGFSPRYHAGEVFAHPEHAECWVASPRRRRLDDLQDRANRPSPAAVAEFFGGQEKAAELARVAVMPGSK
jgi:hypothetical protein